MVTFNCLSPYSSFPRLVGGELALDQFDDVAFVGLEPPQPFAVRLDPARERANRILSGQRPPDEVDDVGEDPQTNQDAHALDFGASQLPMHCKTIDELLKVAKGVLLTAVLAQTDGKFHRPPVVRRELEIQQTRDAPLVNENVVVVKVSVYEAPRQKFVIRDDLCLHVLQVALDLVRKGPPGIELIGLQLLVEETPRHGSMHLEDLAQRKGGTHRRHISPVDLRHRPRQLSSAESDVAHVGEFRECAADGLEEASACTIAEPLDAFTIPCRRDGLRNAERQLLLLQELQNSVLEQDLLG
jgi:hypothetical protein